MALVPSSLIAGLGFLFNKSCKIQQNTPSADSNGEQTPSWSDLANHTAIPCVVFPAFGGPGGNSEFRRKDQTYSVGTSQIMLQGYYPAILNTMRAVVGTFTYDIKDVQHDSQDLLTTLIVEIVS